MSKLSMAHSVHGGQHDLYFYNISMELRVYTLFMFVTNTVSLKNN